MKFKEYPKIHRLDKEETDGILDGIVTVQEKVDGANISIWLDDGEVKCGSRSRELSEGFNGFVDAVKNNSKLLDWFNEHPTQRLYGEWLVKHTITYPETAYKKIYLYDVLDEETNVYLPQDIVEGVAAILDLEYPKLFVNNKKTTEEEIKQFVGKSLIQDNPRGEGVVIKHFGFKDKWGHHAYAKMVHEQFKEANAIVFGGNNKHSESYWEMYIVNKYCTLGRVQKIMNKLQAESEKRLDMEHTSELAGRCLYDMITEEAWEIFGKVNVVDNKKLKSLAMRKYVQIYHDILNNSVSVADKEQT
jgi:hypothetical protein